MIIEFILGMLLGVFTATLITVFFIYLYFWISEYRSWKKYEEKKDEE